MRENTFESTILNKLRGNKPIPLKERKRQKSAGFPSLRAGQPSLANLSQFVSAPSTWLNVILHLVSSVKEETRGWRRSGDRYHLKMFLIFGGRIRGKEAIFQNFKLRENLSSSNTFIVIGSVTQLSQRLLSYHCARFHFYGNRAICIKAVAFKSILIMSVCIRNYHIADSLLSKLKVYPIYSILITNDNPKIIISFVRNDIWLCR